MLNIFCFLIKIAIFCSNFTPLIFRSFCFLKFLNAVIINLFAILPLDLQRLVGLTQGGYTTVVGYLQISASYR